jgi:hypothetical protein
MLFLGCWLEKAEGCTIDWKNCTVKVRGVRGGQGKAHTCRI